MRFRVLCMVSVLTVIACGYLLISPDSQLQAQSPLPTPVIVTSDYTPATLSHLTEPISGFGVLIADLHVQVTANVTFDTLVGLGQYCSNTFLYRVTDMGDLIAHPFVCNGNTMSFNGTGGTAGDTSDYLIALFPSARAAQAAPQSIIRNISTEALPNQYTP